MYGNEIPPDIFSIIKRYIKNTMEGGRDLGVGYGEFLGNICEELWKHFALYVTTTTTLLHEERKEHPVFLIKMYQAADCWFKLVNLVCRLGI